jgi:uncharacterized protein (TIGR02246 family)
LHEKTVPFHKARQAKILTSLGSPGWQGLKCPEQRRFLLKKYFLISLLFFLLCFTFSCQKSEEAVAEQKLGDVKKYEIAETVRGLAKEAFDAGTRDLEDMFSYYSDGAVAVEIGQIDYSWEEHKEKTKAFMATVSDYSYTWEDVEVDVLSEDAAVIFGYYNYMMKDQSGDVYEGKVAWTWVYAKEEGDWKIRHTHISTPMEGN